MRRVAYVIPGLDRLGGAERQMVQLAVALAGSDWRVAVIALSGDGGASRDVLCSAGVEFVPLHMRKGLAHPRGWLRLRRWLRDHRPDIVHAHLPHAAWMARWVRVIAPTHVVIDTVHTSNPGPAMRRLAYRWSDGFSDGVTFVSHDAAAAWTGCGAVRSEKAVVIPNAVDTARFRPQPAMRMAERHRRGVTDEFVWLAAGRLEPVKNYPLLLQAFANLPVEAHLWIAGTGPQQPELESLASALGLVDRVRFLGFVDEMQVTLQGADAIVLSSAWEGLPLVLLEAGACGLPAVVTNVPGSREVVVHGQTGFLAPPGSADALAAAMLRVMDMADADRARMGRLARERVHRDFGLAVVLRRWGALYQNLLARKGHDLGDFGDRFLAVR